MQGTGHQTGAACGEIRVYEYVYEYGRNPSGDELPTYSYTQIC
jgi:hypothetical protein